LQTGVIADALPQYSDGALGNALSHRGLWKMCIEKNQPITILEDDAILRRDFVSKSQEIVSQLPADWDICFWGANADVPIYVYLFGGANIATLKLAKARLHTSVDEFQLQVEPSVPLKFKLGFGIVAYSISPRGAFNYLNGCFPLKTESYYFEDLKLTVSNRWLDAAMCKNHFQRNAYFAFPPIAWTENDKSNSDVLYIPAPHQKPVASPNLAEALDE